MRYRLSCGAARVSCFSSLHWLINQYVKHLIVSDSHDKNKDTVAVFVNFFYNHFDDLGAVHDIIWSYGLSSEFKNKFIVKFLQSYHQTCKRYFFWKYFATGHWKGVVDGIGGKAKTLARAKVMSKGDNRIIVQSSNDFLKAAEHPLTKQEWFTFHRKKLPQEYQKLLTGAW